MITINFDPLITNMAVFGSSVTYFAVEITEITDVLRLFCQLCHMYGFGDCGCSYTKALWKITENISFSQKIQKPLNDVITADFVVVKCGILTSSFFVIFVSD